MKHTKNGYNILYNVITKSERFERCGPGEYKLLREYDDVINRALAGEKPSALVKELLAKLG
ncbi:MAG TPA: hypothetical protein VG204_10160 [Terriglobia bacterium]|nr:hypothetical protein [Terriglobia bacterium]